MNHYFAPVASKDFPQLDGLVLFQLADAAGCRYVLEIRYRDFAMLESEGDHLHHEPIDQAMGHAQKIYGVNSSQWRLLTPEESLSVEKTISTGTLLTSA